MQLLLLLALSLLLADTVAAASAATTTASATATAAVAANATRPPSYYNLSCPFEWSKYSCSHQSVPAPDNAVQSLALLARLGHKVDVALAANSSSRRIFMVGDSLMRQLFIAAACATQTVTTEARVDWQPSWPCHGTKNCVGGGAHGGFNFGSLRFASGAEMHFKPHGGCISHHDLASYGPSDAVYELGILDRLLGEAEAGGTNRTVFLSKHLALPVPESRRALTKDDVVVFSLGIHDEWKDGQPPSAATRDRLAKLARLGAILVENHNTTTPLLVVVTSPTQHFSQSGLHTDRFSGSDRCLASAARNTRRDAERAVLQEGRHAHLILDYDDLGLGGLHVGAGDCSHFCMPGLPDILVERLFQGLASLTPATTTTNTTTSATTPATTTTP